MPTALDEIVRLSVAIKRAEATRDQALEQLRALNRQLAAAARAYAVEHVETSSEQHPAPPWASADLSAPDRVRAFFSSRPHAEVTAGELIEAGVDIKIENLRSTLHRMQKAGELTRPSKGVYAFACKGS